MLQLILESENEDNLRLIQKFAENLNVHCQFILNKVKSESRQQTTSPIYQAFEKAGLIGCIETDDQLSTTYKEKLDFSMKHGGTR